jgi:hypothetical protein
MALPRKTTSAIVIEYFNRLEIEISEEDAALVLEHLTEIAKQALEDYLINEIK